MEDKKQSDRASAFELLDQVLSLSELAFRIVWEIVAAAIETFVQL
jgi:hypothetical protein